MAQDIIQKSRALTEEVAQNLLKQLQEKLDNIDSLSQKKFLSLPETCKLLNVGKTTVYNYRKAEKLKVFKINRKLYFKRSDIESLIEGTIIL